MKGIAEEMPYVIFWRVLIPTACLRPAACTHEKTEEFVWNVIGNSELK
jgi:hypothetical protein